MDNQNRKFHIYLPIILSAVLVLGIFIGAKLSVGGGEVGNIFSFKPWHKDKINEVIDYIQEQYVDTVNKKRLVEKTLAELLQNLDPHSAYIPAEAFQAANEPLQGNFEGIGIEFNVIDDTICVLSVISGGPSEAVGMLAGDRIITIGGQNVAGVKITSKDIFDKLRGQSGTKVDMSVARRGSKKLIDFTIKRGKIPIHSVDIAYMVNKIVGYIKINRFAATTYNEYIKAFNKLQSEGMEKLIIDLRDNPGGYLNAAIDLCDEFLDKGKEIVYTEGRASPKKVYVATEIGHFEKKSLVVLIDEGSASASEILAGAVQDNDRGTIVGRRSFGKGLVQDQIEFSDSSAVRLTIARYYTPTGRCIQKSYKNGTAAYYKEEEERFQHGELQNADSIKFADTLKFKTPAGKIVYGGGGIMPDIFVPLDTIGHSDYLAEVLSLGLLNSFAFSYADKQRDKLNSYKNFEAFNKNFILSPSILNDFIAFAEKNKVKKNLSELKTSEKLIKTQLKALIAKNIWNNDGYFPIINNSDNAFLRALEIIDKN